MKLPDQISYNCSILCKPHKNLAALPDCTETQLPLCYQSELGASGKLLLVLVLRTSYQCWAFG